MDRIVIRFVIPERKEAALTGENGALRQILDLFLLRFLGRIRFFFDLHTARRLIFVRVLSLSRHFLLRQRSLRVLLVLGTINQTFPSLILQLAIILDTVNRISRFAAAIVYLFIRSISIRRCSCVVRVFPGNEALVFREFRTDNGILRIFERHILSRNGANLFFLQLFTRCSRGSIHSQLVRFESFRINHSFICDSNIFIARRQLLGDGSHHGRCFCCRICLVQTSKAVALVSEGIEILQKHRLPLAACSLVNDIPPCIIIDGRITDFRRSINIVSLIQGHNVFLHRHAYQNAQPFAQERLVLEFSKTICCIRFRIWHGQGFGRHILGILIHFIQLKCDRLRFFNHVDQLEPGLRIGDICVRQKRVISCLIRKIRHATTVVAERIQPHNLEFRTCRPLILGFCGEGTDRNQRKEHRKGQQQ